MVDTMPNKEKALLRILRQLHGQRVEEVADHILALFNAPTRWKPEDKHAVYLEPCLSVPLHPLPILGHAQGWGGWEVEDILRKQCSEGVHNAPLGHHPRGSTLVVKQRDVPV